MRHLYSTSVSTTLEEKKLPYQLAASDMDSSHFETSNIESKERTVLTWYKGGGSNHNIHCKIPQP